MPVQAIGMFCEDIRIEQSGADILVGMLPDNVLVHKIPAVIPKFSFYLRVHIPLDVDVESLGGRLVLPWGDQIDIPAADGEMLSKAKLDAGKQHFSFAGIVLKGTMANFVVRNPGRIDAIITINGQDQICGSLNILVATPTASAPPSEQSLPAAPGS